MTSSQLRDLLDGVRAGRVSPDVAHEHLLELLREPIGDLGFAQIDHQRALRQGFPEVVLGVGKTPAQVAAIAKRVVEVEHIGLVNLIAGKSVAPEFVQDAATPRALADALIPLIQEGAVRDQTLGELRMIRQTLAGDARGAAAHVADLAAELLRRA